VTVTDKEETRFAEGGKEEIKREGPERWQSKQGQICSRRKQRPKKPMGLAHREAHRVTKNTRGEGNVLEAAWDITRQKGGKKRNSSLH